MLARPRSLLASRGAGGVYPIAALARSAAAESAAIMGTTPSCCSVVPKVDRFKFTPDVREVGALVKDKEGSSPVKRLLGEEEGEEEARVTDACCRCFEAGRFEVKEAEDEREVCGCGPPCKCCDEDGERLEMVEERLDDDTDSVCFRAFLSRSRSFLIDDGSLNPSLISYLSYPAIVFRCKLYPGSSLLLKDPLVCLLRSKPVADSPNRAANDAGLLMLSRYGSDTSNPESNKPMTSSSWFGTFCASPSIPSL